MRQFNLEEYLKNPNQKVVTRDGHKVRILCTDRKHEYPILALVDSNSTEEIECYTINGKCYRNTEDDSDLFFASEKKRGWVNVYKYISGNTHLGEIYNSKAEAETSHGNGYVTTIKIEWEE